MKKVISILMCLSMVISTLIFVQFSVSATQSKSDNFSKSYTLTGNGANDIVAVAKAQIGRTQSQFGYTEAWCADFVCDCAKLTGMSDKIVPYNYSARGGCTYLINYMINNCSAKKVTSPQAGDFVFYYCSTDKTYCHVAIMQDSTYAINGNSWGGNYSHVERYSASAYFDMHGSGAKCTSRVYVRPNYSNSSTHTHNYYYAGITAEHPHYKIFKCSCGEVDTKISEPSNATSCGICNGRISFEGEGSNIYKGNTLCSDLNGINVSRTANTMVVQTYEYGNPKYTNKYGYEILVDDTGAVVGHREYGNESQLYPKKGGFVVSASGDVLQSRLEQVYKWAKYAYCDYLAKKVYFYEDVYDFNCFAKGLAKGTAYGRLPFPKKSGYIFDGWYTAEKGGTRIMGKSKYNGVNRLYAHWRKSDKITFNVNGASIYNEEIYSKIFDDINAPRTTNKIIIYTSEYNNPRYTNCYGYEIAVNSDGLIIGERDYGNDNMLEVPDGGFVISGGDSLISSLKALRQSNKYVYCDFNNRTLYFYGNLKDFLVGSKYLTVGSEYGVMPTPVRSGYKFVGWFSSESGGKRITSLSKYSGVKVLYAKWEKLSNSNKSSVIVLSKYKTKLKTPKVKLTSGKKSLKIKYTKVKGTVGFQVRYKIKGKWIVKNFNTKKSATKTIKNLKKGKYKVQVRAFNKGKKAYSSWTKVKTVKVK